MGRVRSTKTEPDPYDGQRLQEEGTAMLYMLVVRAGPLSMPVDSVGTYTLTRGECEARMVIGNAASVG
jgi:hypothetical protein